MLLSGFGVSTGSLQMSMRERANPYVAPCRRNCEGLETAELFRIADDLAVRRGINESRAVLAPLAAGRVVAHIAQPRCLGRLRQIDRRRGAGRNRCRRDRAVVKCQRCFHPAQPPWISDRKASSCR